MKTTKKEQIVQPSLGRKRLNPKAMDSTRVYESDTHGMEWTISLQQSEDILLFKSLVSSTDQMLIPSGQTAIILKYKSIRLGSKVMCDFSKTLFLTLWGPPWNS